MWFALLCALGLAAPMTYAAEAVDYVPAFAETAESVGNVVPESADFVVGQHYGGGIIFWIDDSGQQGYNWWGDRFYLVTGATSTVVGTGKINTRKIVRVQGRGYTYAALLCVNYRGGGFADWFLPSKDELYQLYLQKDVVGGFIRGALLEFVRV